jgi:hypothetical protein
MSVQPETPTVNVPFVNLIKLLNQSGSNNLLYYFATPHILNDERRNVLHDLVEKAIPKVTMAPDATGKFVLTSTALSISDPFLNVIDETVLIFNVSAEELEAAAGNAVVQAKVAADIAGNLANVTQNASLRSASAKLKAGIKYLQNASEYLSETGAKRDELEAKLAEVISEEKEAKRNVSEAADAVADLSVVVGEAAGSVNIQNDIDQKEVDTLKASSASAGAAAITASTAADLSAASQPVTAPVTAASAASQPSSIALAVGSAVVGSAAPPTAALVSTSAGRISSGAPVAPVRVPAAADLSVPVTESRVVPSSIGLAVGSAVVGVVPPEEPEVELEYDKYCKMLKMNVPGGAVEQRLVTANLTDKVDLKKCVDGKYTGESPVAAPAGIPSGMPAQVSVGVPAQGSVGVPAAQTETQTLEDLTTYIIPEGLTLEQAQRNSDYGPFLKMFSINFSKDVIKRSMIRDGKNPDDANPKKLFNIIMNGEAPSIFPENLKTWQQICIDIYNCKPENIIEALINRNKLDISKLNEYCDPRPPEENSVCVKQRLVSYLRNPDLENLDVQQYKQQYEKGLEEVAIPTGKKVKATEKDKLKKQNIINKAKKARIEKYAAYAMAKEYEVDENLIKDTIRKYLVKTNTNRKVEISQEDVNYVYDNLENFLTKDEIAETPQQKLSEVEEKARAFILAVKEESEEEGSGWSSD